MKRGRQAQAAAGKSNIPVDMRRPSLPEPIDALEVIVQLALAVVEQQQVMRATHGLLVGGCRDESGYSK